MSAPKLSKQEVALLDAKGRLADIFVSLTGTDEKDEQAFAEFCAEAEGLLEDWLEARAPISEQFTYFVEFIDHDGTQRPIYLRGQSNEHIKAIMNDYDIVVIDNTEMPEKCYWATKEVES